MRCPVGKFWKSLGKGIGKGLTWVIRNPQMLEIIIDSIVKSKMDKESPKDPPPAGR
jgi:hypothetical protein